MAEGSSGGLAAAWNDFERGRYDVALRSLSAVGDEALDIPSYWLLRGECLRRLERRDEGLAAVREGLRGCPDHVGLLDALGLALVGLDDLSGGEAAYRAALDQDPDNPIILGHLALALAKQERFVEAKGVVDSMMTLAPDSTDALTVRAQVAFLAGDPLADGYVRDLLRQDPDNATGHLLRGSLAVRKRKAQPAARAFAEAAQLDPSSRPAAAAARETRIAAHPLLKPVAPLLLRSRRQNILIYFVVLIVLRALHLTVLTIAFGVFWLVFMILGPRLLRAHYQRKYGSL